MPSTSKKQHNFMAAIANSPAFAKKAGVPQSVGKDFVLADKGKKFAKGGVPSKVNNQDTRHGKMDMPFTKLSRYAGLKSGGDMKNMKKAGANAMAAMKTQMAPPVMRQKGVMPAPSQEAMMNGMTGMKKGGVAGMHPMPDGKMMKNSAMKMGGMKMGGMAMVKKGGKMVPAFAADGKGKMKMGGMAGMKKMMGGGMAGYAKGGVIKMASGGSVSSASRRADGIAQRGKTRC